MRALTERELRVRYKQAYLGFAWAVFTPAVLMVIFTILTSHNILNVRTGGKPAYLFSYVGLVPWAVFAAAIGQGSQSLISNLYLVNRIYCPREVFPLSSVVVAVCDGVVASLLFLALFPLGHTAPEPTTYWDPLLFVVQLAFTVGVTLFLSVVVVFLRDLRHVVPVIVQFGLFATPIIYTLDKIPARFRALYSALNPLGPVIDGYRRATLFGQGPQWRYVGIAAIAAVLYLLLGYVSFRRLETRIADVA